MRREKMMDEDILRQVLGRLTEGLPEDPGITEMMERTMEMNRNRPLTPIHMSIQAESTLRLASQMDPVGQVLWQVNPHIAMLRAQWDFTILAILTSVGLTEEGNAWVCQLLEDTAERIRTNDYDLPTPEEIEQKIALASAQIPDDISELNTERDQ
jgi:hypothetical protein